LKREKLYKEGRGHIKLFLLKPELEIFIKEDNKFTKNPLKKEIKLFSLCT